MARRETNAYRKHARIFYLEKRDKFIYYAIELYFNIFIFIFWDMVKNIKACNNL